MAETEDDPKTFNVPAPGGIFFAGWIIAIIVALVATAGLVLARELWVSRQTSALETQNQAGPHVLVSDVLRAADHQPSQTAGDDPRLRRDRHLRENSRLPEDHQGRQGRPHSEGRTARHPHSPELDQQVATARANYNLARVTDKRYEQLVRAQVVPQQTADETHFTMLQDKAILDQDLANQQYETITAPFDGIVTARYVDPGHLVPANTTPGTPGSGAIISVSRMSPLRVFVYVPQNVAPFIKNGDAATITAMGYAGQKFTGTITRHPEALSPDTRTMLVEVDLPNENQALYPGMYANAEFIVAMGSGSPMVPDDALIFRDGKVYVPVVRNNQLHLTEVTLGYDNGQTVEVTSGIDPKDKVAVNVGQAARDGENVQPVQNTQ